MENIVIVGSQWGDEGKGKITDVFAQKADMVVRWAGGNNAGHTITFDHKQFKLNIIPSGIFNSKTINVIASGCVINLENLVREINNLKENGFDCNNLRISDRAHIIFPYHMELDGYQEEYRGADSIGTTKKGIGPCYQDKMNRIGIRMTDFFDIDDCKKKFLANVQFKNALFKNIYHKPEIDGQKMFDEQLNLFNQIKHLITDTSILVNDYAKASKRIVFEGAQGIMLDIDQGTYPFVTSSHPTALSIPSDVGISWKYIHHIIGITKAYSTRVGNGAFPSELLDEVGDAIREKGHEYGTTTKRPRRIGWFDAVSMRHSLRIGGQTHLAIMLLDVLSGQKKLKICVRYRLDGKVINYVPAKIQDYQRCEPIYEEMDGWDQEIKGITKFSELPKNAQFYILKIEKLLNTNVALISTGPDRNDLIILDKSILQKEKL
ncbi:adenylosuccinate synthase [[Mycoplasma] testudinis]|uniref:adenylosuccinate synthase n=1 Tax=[Mycoplasma] testudinis TaxID=33924 RepID=UPI000485395C|nr:adenylosuccinate synthase [[Mycoplasma] testudinis]